ncbi:S41 family peptidase [Carboxylicivirga marina]|uniref:Tail specific protease domain-containing protein n=1 Tax=Carboxylicivirga marina TaxID=2800988 RepID=A0ABS1HP01_9BACT|nr:S41 family peptidase [Carboxylicivirga marina]MBK3519376.1 hypothetical protein [Carboxylicivirga marina]
MKLSLKIRNTLIALLIFSNQLVAQTTYDHKLLEVIADIEKNYAGFSNKVDNQRVPYEFFKADLINQSINNTTQLRAHVDRYLQFFNDGHLYSFNFNISNFEHQLNKHRKELYQFKVVNDNTCYLKIGSFSNKINVDSLLATAYDAMSQHKNLIIDIRNNGGGGDSSFDKLLPIIATNDMFVRNIDLLATPDNWKHMKDITKMEEWNPLYENQFVSAPWIKCKEEYLKLYKYKATNEFPKNVAVLMNRKTGSAAEQFVLCAKQSFKVKTFGENTSGSFDYSNCRHFEVIKDSLYISAPTTRVKTLPDNKIDPNGMSPDFYLRPENQIEQVLEYIQKWE